MRELTFQGFLREYVKKLSLAETQGYYFLLKELSQNPRLKEPLLLYAKTTMTKQQFERFLQKSESLAAENNKYFLGCKNEEQLLTALSECSALPLEYSKVYRSYLAKRDRHKAAIETKKLMRARILKLQKEKGISCSRICAELQLNPGNLNAFLKHDAPQKLSLATARKIMEFLLAFEQPPINRYRP